MQTHAAAEYTLNYAEIASDRGARAEALMWWADELKKRSDGRIEVDIHWSGALVKGPDILKGVAAGLADTGTLVSPYFPADMPLWTFGDVPFNEPDPWVAMHAWQEMRAANPHLAAEAKDNGVKVLFSNATGPNQLLCTEKVVDTQEKVKGTKMRMTGGYIPFFESLGASVITTTGSELYQAMDRGIVECAVWFTQYVPTYKLHEVADKLIMADLGQSSTYGGGIGLDLFNSMPADLQQIVTQTSLEYMDRYSMNLLRDIEKAKVDLQAGIDGHVVELIPMDPQERERWKVHSKAALDDWKAKTGLSDKEATAFVDQLEELMAKYRKIRDEQGYPWQSN